MSSTTKTIVWIVIVVIVILGIWYFVQLKSQPSNSQIDSSVASAAQQSAVDNYQPSPKNVSDDSVDKDMTNIDANIKALDNDSAQADQSLNDQPISQAE
jgi:hypothetical protein